MTRRPSRRQTTTTMTKKPPLWNRNSRQQRHPLQEDNKKHRRSSPLSVWIRRHPVHMLLLLVAVVLSAYLLWLRHHSPSPSFTVAVAVAAASRKNKGSTSTTVKKEEKDAKDASSREKVPKPLAQNLQMEPVLFVHVGKAGGSTIHDLNKKAYKLCKEKDKLPSNTSTPYSCTLSRMTPSKRVHMWQKQDSYPNYSQFLVTVRNPIDRLVSWFYYSRTHRPAKPTTASTTMHSCYNTINDLVTATMLPNTNLTGNEDYPPYFHNTTNNCVEVGRKCLMGENFCKQHNFYNNEVYMENLVYWRSCYNKLNPQPQIADHNDNGQDHCEARNIRIDVIRQEYAEFDLFHVLKLWGVPPNVTPETGFNYEAKNTLAMATTSSRSRNKTLEVSPSKYISPEGVRALCEAICPELLAYKSVVANADNLNSSDVVNAFQDLDDSCHVLVDKICGTEFHYRNYKQLKKKYGRKPHDQEGQKK